MDAQKCCVLAFMLATALIFLTLFYTAEYVGVFSGGGVSFRRCRRGSTTLCISFLLTSVLLNPGYFQTMADFPSSSAVPDISVFLYVLMRCYLSRQVQQTSHCNMQELGLTCIPRAGSDGAPNIHLRCILLGSMHFQCFLMCSFNCGKPKSW